MGESHEQLERRGGFSSRELRLSCNSRSNRYGQRAIIQTDRVHFRRHQHQLRLWIIDLNESRAFHFGDGEMKTSPDDYFTLSVRFKAGAQLILDTPNKTNVGGTTQASL